MFNRALLRASRSAPTQFSRTQYSPAQFTPAVRWYADAAAEKPASTQSTDASTSSTSTTADPTADLQSQLTKKDKEMLDLKDKYLRSVADFRNLQDRTARETKAAKDFAIQRFARDLVESVDNLDRALSTVAPEKLGDGNPDLTALHEGVKMTDSILISTLKKHGLERFDPADKGDAFDPNVHEAVFMAPQPGKQDGSVFFTQQKGFYLNGRVLRPAKVGVVKNA